MPEKQKQPENPRLYAMLLFVLYFLIFQLAESAVNDRTVEVLNADAVNGVYAAGLFFTASGYLLFAFWYRRFGITARKGIFISSGAVYLLCVLMIHHINQPVVFLLTAAGCLLAAGYIGGFSHYILAVTLRDGKYTGRVISIAIALGVVVQYAVQNLLSLPVTLLVWTSATVLTILIGLPQIGNDNHYLPVPSRTTARFPSTRLLMLMTVVALMSLIISLDDTICLTLHAQGSVNLFGLPRLFYAGSILLAGYLADRQKRTYLPLATVCVVLISGFVFTFLNRPDTYWINVCLLYIYSGFYVSFFTVMFLDAAAKSSHPELWAGMGRVVRSYTLSAATVPFIYLYQLFGILPMMVLSVALSAGCLLLFFPAECSAQRRHRNRPRMTPVHWNSFQKNITSPPGKPKYLPRLWTMTGGSGNWQRSCTSPNALLTAISPVFMKKPVPVPGLVFL